MDDWLKAVLALGVLFVAAPVLAMLLFVPVMGGSGMYGGGMGGGGMYGGGMGGWIGLLVPFGILPVLGYAVYRAFGTAERGDAALDELRAAYARGDLTTEEYEERRERLGESRE
ncbi:putative membrane protein [Halarchaeum solikamskense]|uniref:SHOCT domain-containing protein n=1 Tax=Halarchaeum nitratireducens TaxID=489913 RepID=UPI001B3AE2F1|nr:SHOCT domain-containing protein [Halarchaeum solikamskense]MBP2252210.1 putative membrane protein [Halarchaeum solikamskense]